MALEQPELSPRELATRWATSTITPCRPIVGHWRCSDIMSPTFGGARLRRRSQKDRLTWARMTQLVDDWLPKTTAVKPNSKCSTSSNCHWGCLNHESAASGVAPSDHGWRKNAFPVTWVTPAPGGGLALIAAWILSVDIVTMPPPCSVRST
jgi:hypothetical protein